FREFLLERAREVLTPEEWSDCLRRAAHAMLAQGEVEEAFDLFVEAADWSGAARLVVESAPALLDEGRGKLIVDLIERLPGEPGASVPGLQFWGGSALLDIDMPRAERWLEPAFRAFDASGDVTGQLMSAALIVESHYYALSDYSTLDSWVPILEKLLP